MRPAKVSDNTSLRRSRKITTGICIECALRRHDFREVMGALEGDEDFPAMRLPQALIDGRNHTLLSYAWTRQENCVECGQKVANLYILTR
jgi:hypothetical protein